MNLDNTVLDIKDTNGDTYHISDIIYLLVNNCRNALFWCELQFSNFI
jgi:hypothetical protein